MRNITNLNTKPLFIDLMTKSIILLKDIVILAHVISEIITIKPRDIIFEEQQLFLIFGIARLTKQVIQLIHGNKLYISQETDYSNIKSSG